MLLYNIKVWLLYTYFILISIRHSEAKKPHIIYIVADDLGWNDVGFHGSNQIPTPNIDALAYSGVILNNYYVQPLCTPSRSAIMTGYMPIHTGLQSHTIGGAQPYGMPLELHTLPEYLNNLGYESHHVGKWHLGFYHRNFTPTLRGFKSHFGYWSGRIDYYDHTACEIPGYWGYDMRRNLIVAKDAYGKYTTDLFTNEAINVISNHNSSKPLFLYLAHLAVHSANPHDPLQAPADIVEKFNKIQDVNRRKFAAMLWKLDDSIGKTIKALHEANMLDDSIIVFTTDNGGPAGGFNQNAASNWPFRGVKASLWEGGTRGAACVWSSKLIKGGRVSNEMFHVTDWLPSLYKAAGGDNKDLGPIDGMDLWDTIISSAKSKRKEFLYNYDPKINGAALRIQNYKIIYNPSGYGHYWDQWFGPSGRNSTRKYSTIEIKNSIAGKIVSKYIPKAFSNIKTIRKSAEVLCSPIPPTATKFCNDSSSPCMFDIANDPCEYQDISKDDPDTVHLLLNKLNSYIKTAVEPLNKPWDPASNPKYWDYTWTNWKDMPSPIFHKQSRSDVVDHRLDQY